MPGPPGLAPDIVIGGAVTPRDPTRVHAAGSAEVHATITPDGDPSDCHLVSQAGDAADAAAAMAWLSGASHPRYRPARQDGLPTASPHAWHVDVVPRGVTAPAEGLEIAASLPNLTWVVVRK